MGQHSTAAAAGEAPRRPTLFVYDADCGFCTRTAGWLDRRVGGAVTFSPSHAVDLADLGLTVDDVTRAAWLVHADGHLARGADAIAGALRAGSGPARIAGGALALPPVRWIARPVYRLVAQNRHAMPGGTAACRIDGGPGAALVEDHDPHRSDVWRGRVVTYAMVAVLVTFALAGKEAWPLTSFSLFSHVRTDEPVTLQVVALDRSGHEIPVNLGADHAVTRGASHLIPHLRAKSPAERRAEVSSWMRSAGIDPDQMAAARIYRTVRHVSTDGSPGAVISRRLTLQIPLPRS